MPIAASPPMEFQGVLVSGDDGDLRAHGRRGQKS
jgi:hypothetical protein